MDHEGDSEIPEEEDKVRLSPRRRVTFRSESANGVQHNGDSDVKPSAHCVAMGEDVNGRSKQSYKYFGDDSEKKMCDSDWKKSSDNVVGILRSRSISPSPLVFEALMGTKPRFELSKLSKAMMRSKETRGCIKRLKKQIFQPLERHQRYPKSIVASITPSHSQEWKENRENRTLSLVQQERRMLCLKSTKAMMKQSLPLSMMPFVEETLKAVHFLRRRRKENGHGRIIHQILIEQHKQVLKELEQNEDNIGETSHSSRQQSKKTEQS